MSKKYDFYEIKEVFNLEFDHYAVPLELAGAKVLDYEAFGSYQGDWIAKVEYQGQIQWIKGSYGSCSGCDALEAELGWPMRLTKEGWKKKLAEFGQDYLDNYSYTYNGVMELCSENLSWDVEAKDIIVWLKERKENRQEQTIIQA